MKSLSLFKQLSIGFGLSLLATILIHSFSIIVNYHKAFNMTLMITSLLYIASILNNSQLKTGRTIILSLLFSAVILSSFFNLSNQLVLVCCLLSIFITRAIYYQHHLMDIIYDIGLIGFGLLIASGVLVSSKSWFLSYWCFFFIQAFLVYAADIFSAPNKQITNLNNSNDSTKSNQGFKSAKNQAEIAINQILTN